MSSKRKSVVASSGPTETIESVKNGVLVSGTKFLTRGENERLQVLVAQRQGAIIVANAATNTAKQLSDAVDTEVESLKAHYGIDKSRDVQFDFADQTMLLLPPRAVEV